MRSSFTGPRPSHSMCQSARPLYSPAMRAAPAWAIVLLLLVIVGLGIYAYFTTPLPFGLSAVIRTPGGANVPAGAEHTRRYPRRADRGRSAAGAGRHQRGHPDRPAQPGLPEVSAIPRLVHGALDRAAKQRQRAALPAAQHFRLIDDRGRNYAIDIEATRAANESGGRRYLFEASVPPGGRFPTFLAFETPADVAGLTLRVTLGYGELELPR